MKRHLIILLTLFVALGAFGTGCVKNKAGTGTAGAGYVDQVIIGYDEFGNPIWGSPEDALGNRFDPNAEIGGAGFDPVYFDFDSDRVPPAEMFKVDNVVLCLQQYPMYGVIVDGHCDERGSNEYNLALGEKRSLAVRAAIIGRGIDGNRIQTRSYGEERPVAFDHNEASWRLNRRAEFTFTQ